MTLSHLRTLESKGSEQAREAMAKQLNRFVEAEFPSTENSEMIRKKIQEYAETSAVFHSLKQKSEQAGTGQPATRPESKSEGGDKPQPEAEGRPR
jgi:predicted translin family RNA/ssDNA-binding protein